MEDQLHAIRAAVTFLRRHEDSERALHERCASLRERIDRVTEYRDLLIHKRDHKASQIPLRPHEERMWATKIDLAEQTIATLKAELSAATQ